MPFWKVMSCVWMAAHVAAEPWCIFPVWNHMAVAAKPPYHNTCWQLSALSFPSKAQIKSRMFKNTLKYERAQAQRSGWCYFMAFILHGSVSTCTCRHTHLFQTVSGSYSDYFCTVMLLMKCCLWETGVKYCFCLFSIELYGLKRVWWNFEIYLT